MGAADRAVPHHHLVPFLPRRHAGQARAYVSESVKEVLTMGYVSNCCAVPAVEETLNTWHDYSGESPGLVKPQVYGTCSKCKEQSLFSEGE
jgi:hypothetical protein